MHTFGYFDKLTKKFNYQSKILQPTEIRRKIIALFKFNPFLSENLLYLHSEHNITISKKISSILF